MTEEEIPEDDYSDDEFERNDLLDSGKPGKKKEEKPSPSVNTSTKQFLAQQIAERDLKASGSEYSNNSLFQHSLKDKIDYMKQAQGELQVSSNALLKDKM